MNKDCLRGWEIHLTPNNTCQSSKMVTTHVAIQDSVPSGQVSVLRSYARRHGNLPRIRLQDLSAYRALFSSKYLKASGSSSDPSFENHRSTFEVTEESSQEPAKQVQKDDPRPSDGTNTTLNPRKFETALRVCMQGFEPLVKRKFSNSSGLQSKHTSKCDALSLEHDE